MIVLPERSSHWYSKDGKPCHTVPAKGGGERNVNLRWDRHLGLLPSVTSIISCKAKPGLESWKITQGIMSALTLPRKPSETDDDFAKRVVVDMEEQSRSAAEFGSRVHRAAEYLHLGENAVMDLEAEPFVAGYREWFHQNVRNVDMAEWVLVNKAEGYAGCVDLVCDTVSAGGQKPTIIDLKTQGVKENPKVYNDWLMQLAAYAQAHYLYDLIFEIEWPRLISVVIDSTKPSEPFIHEWPEEEKEPAWKAFLACRDLWCWEKKYWPHHC